MQKSASTGGLIMGWFIFAFIAIIGIICVAFLRNVNQNYRIGSGMFKNSEYNLDEKDDFSDKDYYDENNSILK